MNGGVKRATVHAIRPEDAPRPSAGSPGQLLGGKYRLDEAIARGGSARVWRATHVTLNRPVAVKFVEAWGATSQERIDRFLREAKVAASVRHKNVVDILDFGAQPSPETGEEEPYMVMELLEGEALDQRLARAPMTSEEVAEVALQLLSGLDAVHRAGIVHRDLKPGNVFLSDDPDGVFARLLDFGISQGVDEERGGERLVVGTPEYMSPEQAFGDSLDARSDIYSAGVVLYEMLSGTVPFEDADPQLVVDMVAHGTPVPLSTLRPDAAALASVVDRAMAKEPNGRFDTARAMRRALVDAMGSGDATNQRRIAATPTSEPRSGIVPAARRQGGESATLGGGVAPAPMARAPERPAWLVPVLAVVMAIAIGGGALFVWSATQEAPSRFAPTAVPERGDVPPVAAPPRGAPTVPDEAPVAPSVLAPPAPSDQVPTEAVPVDDTATVRGEVVGRPRAPRAPEESPAPAATPSTTPHAEPEPTVSPDGIVRELDF